MNKEVISQGYNSLAEDCSSELDTPSASQIIIDGVNVAGCEFLGLYNVCKLRSGSTCAVECENCLNCYYKQLQRKEQYATQQSELCKTYRKEIADLVKELSYRELEYDRLSRDYLKQNEWLQQRAKECEELRKANDEKNEFLTQLGMPTSSSYKRVKYHIKNLNNEINSYKQALEKIEKIIKNYENEDICTFPDFDLKTNIKLIINQCNAGYIDILDIINEVNND